MLSVLRSGDRFVRTMASVGLLGLCGIGVSAWRLATTPESRPVLSQMPTKGDQLVAVYIGSSDCRGSKLPEFPEVERRTMAALSRLAQREGAHFVTVGVALDVIPRLGAKYLEKFGPFDISVTGGGWMNPGAVQYIWRDYPGDGTVPQIVVVRRSVDVPPRGVVVSPDSVLGRLIGIEGMQAFLEREEQPVASKK